MGGCLHRLLLNRHLLERGIYRFGGGLAWVLNTAPLHSLLRLQLDLLPEGPPREALATVRRILVAEAEDLAGHRVRSRLHTPDGYTFTAETALAVVEKVLRGEFEVGFRTPAQVYGADFVLTANGVFRTDLVV